MLCRKIISLGTITFLFYEQYFVEYNDNKTFDSARQRRLHVRFKSENLMFMRRLNKIVKRKCRERHMKCSL